MALETGTYNIVGNLMSWLNYLPAKSSPLIPLLVKHKNCKLARRIPNLSNVHGTIKWAVTRDFQQCGILLSVDSDEPVQPPFKLRNLI